MKNAKLGKKWKGRGEEGWPVIMEVRYIKYRFHVFVLRLSAMFGIVAGEPSFSMLDIGLVRGVLP